MLEHGRAGNRELPFGGRKFTLGHSQSKITDHMVQQHHSVRHHWHAPQCRGRPRTASRGEQRDEWNNGTTYLDAINEDVDTTRVAEECKRVGELWPSTLVTLEVVNHHGHAHLE